MRVRFPGCAVLAIGAALTACGGAGSRSPSKTRGAPAHIAYPSAASAPASRSQPRPLGRWESYAKPIPGAKEAAARGPDGRTLFVPLDVGGWRCHDKHCEVLDDEGRRVRVHEFPLTTGMQIFTSPQHRFGAFSSGASLWVFAFIDGRARTVKTGDHDIRSIVVDDDGSVLLSVLPHGSLVHISPDGRVSRTVVASPNGTGATFVLSAHAPWLAYTAGATGGELLWSRAEPAHPVRLDVKVYFNGSHGWTASMEGETWRVEPTSKTRLDARWPQALEVGPWGHSGLLFRVGLETIELRGPDIDLRERIRLPFTGVPTSSPCGERVYVVAPDDGRVMVRRVAGPDSP